MALYALATAIIVGAGVLWFLNRESTKEVDQFTLCPKGGRIADVTAILLDMSDTLGEAQAVRVRNEFERLRRQVPRFGMIAVYALDGDATRLIRPVLELCNPGDGSDLNIWYQNPSLAKQKWEREFSSKLDLEIGKLLEMSPTASSPILEGVQAVAVQTFDAPRNQQAHKRLVIVSDLMQNVSGKMNHYSDIVPFATFRKTAYYNEVRADLNDVEVNVLYVVRPQAPQKWPEHRLFWEQYFRAQGATVERIEPLYGVQ